MKGLFRILPLAFISLFSLVSQAGPAVLFDDVDVAAKKEFLPAPTPTKGKSFLKRRTSEAEMTSVDYIGALELRARRRVGVGISGFGQVGTLGAAIELNFTAPDSFVAQFGGGNRFNALAFQWKHVFGGDSLSPYASIGYARWYNSGPAKGPFSSSNPRALVDRFLTAEEKQSGQFAKDILAPSIGLQYYQLHGQYIGSSVYGEIVFLSSLQDLSPVPTAGLGYIYYF